MGRHSKPDKLVPISATVSPKLSELLSQLATERGLSVAQLCRQFIMQGMLSENGASNEHCKCQEVRSEQ